MTPETFAPHEPTAGDWRDAANALEVENATLTDRLEALTQELATVRATLTERSEAVNRTGESNERLRATIAAVYAATVEVERMAYDGQSAVRMIRTALADQEPARD